MPCTHCGLGNVSGKCAECRMLNRMEDDLEAGAYPEGEAGGDA